MKKLIISMFLIGLSLMGLSIDIYGGYNYVFTPDSTISSFFDVSVDIPLNENDNTQFGLSLNLLSITTDVDSFFFSLTTYGKYNTKTSSGIFSVFGKGGAVFPIDFSFSSVGYMVFAGIRYYFNQFFVGFSYEVIYLYNDLKLDVIPIQFGYNF
ncbi:hypothetical protein [Thermosipho atlanticus]|uniref:Outer membrane protein beta-barrel domain-containing protein n=1 Tax=Thermosipho atlanticus DSM 15807 TaxID=1123380 RepID=A0A1M5RWH4_9BACT|nr:hypothetical protein [Thermosipho atlanticus]SHH30529.1 hypothetical protein SAMN02745199_0658 [Thermosipho atlanticus DSM 15807]